MGLLIALAWVLPARAGNQVWTGPGPRARSVEAIAHDPFNSQRWWIASFGAGVYRSVDGGASWTGHRDGLINTFVRCLAIEPLHPDSVFCGTNDGVFLSVDGGILWNRVLSTTHSVRSLAIHPVRTGILYAGVYGDGVYKSLNGGKNWSLLQLGLTNLDVRDIALHPTRPETLLAATGTGGGIHRSFNGGLTWAPVPDTTATNGACEQIQFDRLDPLRIYAAELERGVLKSADGGNSWTRINRGLTSLRARSLAIVDTLRYLGTDGSGVFFTTLSDSLWHPVPSGLTNPVIDALWSESTTPGTAWAGTDGGGVFVTTNRGGSWSQLDGGLLTTFGFSVAVDPNSHRVVDGTGFGDQFWSSADQGLTWARAVGLVTHDSEHGVLVDPVVPKRDYLTSYGAGVYRSDDNGLTWIDPDSLNGTLGNHFVRSLVAYPGQGGHLFVGTGIGPFESTDGGAHWVSRVGDLPPSFSVHALALVPGALPTIYVGSDSSGVWKSVDGGASWSARNSGLPALFIHTLAVDVANILTIYAATDSGVFKSTNGATSWVSARTGLPTGEVRALVQDPAHRSVLFCGIYGAGVFESLDRGASWQPLLAQSGLGNLGVRSLAIDPAFSTLYAGTDGGLMALTNYPLPAAAVEIRDVSDLALDVGPSPSAGAVRIHYILPRAGRMSVTVFDLAGARVRTLAEGEMAAGQGQLMWDGRDEGGRRAAAGLYFVRLAGAGDMRVARVCRLSR